MGKIARPQKYEFKCDCCKTSHHADTTPTGWVEFTIPTPGVGEDDEFVLCPSCRAEVVREARGMNPRAATPYPLPRPAWTPRPMPSEDMRDWHRVLTT